MGQKSVKAVREEEIKPGGRICETGRFIAGSEREEVMYEQNGETEEEEVMDEGKGELAIEELVPE